MVSGRHNEADWCLASLGEVDLWCPFLTDEETNRSTLFPTGALRDRHMVARGVCRDLLARCTGRDAKSLRFTEGRAGKPMLESGDGWDFNVSHSGDYVLVAARRGGVGVDLEKIREVREMKKLVERYFHPDEAAGWLDVADVRKMDVFFRLWTAREAAMKCLGLGLAGGLSITRVDPQFIALDAAPAKVGETTVHLSALPAPEGYAMSLAVD